jgi:hypothetical protein
MFPWPILKIPWPKQGFPLLLTALAQTSAAFPVAHKMLSLAGLVDRDANMVIFRGEVAISEQLALEKNRILVAWLGILGKFVRL